jgi:DNA polymerase elongation subunit (family B)
MGIKRNVATYDAASLYPSIILAKDLSPDIDKMLPKVITFILNEREKYRELKLLGKASESDKTTEQSLKYIANSFYGVCASPYFKLYNMEIASTITRTGREILKSVEQEIEGLGYNVIYADTDGSFVENVNTLEDAEKIKKHINTHLKQWATQHKIADGFEPFVKFEKWFSTLFFKKKSTGDEAAKKKYVGRLVYKDGHPKDELSYTGIEIKRSDTAPYTKTIMESFFKKVLIDGDAGGAVEDVRAAYIKVKNGKVPAHDIAIPKAVHKTTNNTAHVKGMNHGIEVFGIRFNSSKKPKLLYCKSPFEEVCVDDETTEEQIKLKLSINYEKQADRVVSQKMRSLIESLGYNWEKIIGGQHNFNDLFGDVK